MSDGPTPTPIKPEDCPEPWWHRTHTYCAVCTWTRAKPPLKAGDKVWIPAVVAYTPEFPDTYIPVVVMNYVGKSAATGEVTERHGLNIQPEDIKRG